MGGVGFSTSQQRVEEAPMAGLDYLMSLPLEMLDNILRRLPFEKLVGTCCLSPSWHRRWESVPDLDIWLGRGSSTARDPHFLRWPCASTNSLPAPCGGASRPSTASPPMSKGTTPTAAGSSPWRASASRCLGSSLTSSGPPTRPCPHVVGPALYSRSALTHLQLSGYCHLLRAPQGFVGFPNLCTLSLDDVVLPFHGAAAQLQLIISSAPHLTRLLLNDVMISDYKADIETCVIRAPNLRFLRMTMSLDNGCRIAGELPLLKVAQISIDPLVGTPNFINTFRRISGVEKLFLHTDSDQVHTYIASNAHGTDS